MKQKTSYIHPKIKTPWGAVIDRELMIRGQVQTQGKSGAWHNARPEPYYSLIERIKLAWDVLRYKADALYWTIDFDK